MYRTNLTFGHSVMLVGRGRQLTPTVLSAFGKPHVNYKTNVLENHCATFERYLSWSLLWKYLVRISVGALTEMFSCFICVSAKG